jgi:hypothetical protein
MSHDPEQSKVSSGRAAIFLRRVRHRITSTQVRNPIVWWRHQGLKPADVILGSYPRSGSTWLRFVLFEILTGKPSSFDDVNSAFRGLSDHKQGWPLFPNGGRFIGTHEPWRPVYKKGVYLVRDVRDVALSEFAFEKNLGIGRPTLGAYLDDMLRRGKRHGTWPHHVQSWMDSPLASTGNLLLIRYEDLRKNSVDVFMKIVQFLGVQVEVSAVERAIANNSVQKMREKEDNLYKQENYSKVARKPQKSVQPGGRFVRSGKMGGWQEKLTPEQVRFIEQYTASTLLRLQYPVVTMDSAGISSDADASMVSHVG